MLNEKDIYTHLRNGGSVEDLQKALENEIKAANDRIKQEKDAELKAKAQQAMVDKARKNAAAALKEYCTLVNPAAADLDLVNHILDFCEKIEVVIDEKKGVRGSGEIKWPSISFFDLFD